MTRSDPGAATGNQTYTLLPPCDHCGVPGAVHPLKADGTRGKPSAGIGPRGERPDCPGYTPKEAPDGIQR